MPSIIIIILLVAPCFLIFEGVFEVVWGSILDIAVFGLIGVGVNIWDTSCSCSKSILARLFDCISDVVVVVGVLVVLLLMGVEQVEDTTEAVEVVVVVEAVLERLFELSKNTCLNWSSSCLSLVVKFGFEFEFG